MSAETDHTMKPTRIQDKAMHRTPERADPKIKTHAFQISNFPAPTLSSLTHEVQVATTNSQP